MGLHSQMDWLPARLHRSLWCRFRVGHADQFPPVGRRHRLDPELRLRAEVKTHEQVLDVLDILDVLDNANLQ